MSEELPSLAPDNAAAFANEINEHSVFVRIVWALILETLSLLTTRDLEISPWSRVVSAVLLARIADDLSCVDRLCELGHPKQAASIAASILEAAYTICFVGNSDELANEWSSHSAPKRAFRRVSDQLIPAGVALFFEEESDRRMAIEKEGRTYAQRCWFKHISPLTHGLHDPEEWKTVGAFVIGPQTDEPAIRTAWFALQHGGLLALMALMAFRDHHFAQLGRGEQVVKAHAILARLEERGKERWGTKDPLAGLW